MTSQLLFRAIQHYLEREARANRADLPYVQALCVASKALANVERLAPATHETAAVPLSDTRREGYDGRRAA